MGGFTDFIGLVSGYIRLGLSGVRLKNNSGVLDVRNAGDSAYANVAANRVSLVDPANPSRAVGLDSPTLAAGWSMTLPAVIGNDGDVLTRSSTGGSEWARRGGGFNSRRVDISNAYRVPPGGKDNIVKLYCYSGNRETLWNYSTQRWEDVTPSTVTLDFATAGNLAPFVPHDIVEYIDPATRTAAQMVLAWASNAGVTITNVTNASPPVVTVGSGHGFSVGDLVIPHLITGAAGSLNNRQFRVSATASTTVTLQTVESTTLAAPGAYTSGGKLYKINSVLSPAHTRGYEPETGYIVTNLKSYLGVVPDVWGKVQATVCYGEEYTKIYDTLDRPFISNMYNKILRPVGTVSTGTAADTWTPDSTNDTPTNSRPANNSYGAARMWFLCADSHEMVNLKNRLMALPPGVASENTTYVSYMGLDTVANYNPSTPASFSLPDIFAHVQGSAVNSGDRYIVPVITEIYQMLGYGLHFAQVMEFIQGSGTNDWNVWRNQASGSNNQFTYKGGFFGSYMR